MRSVGHLRVAVSSHRIPSLIIGEEEQDVRSVCSSAPAAWMTTATNAMPSNVLQFISSFMRRLDPA